MRVYTNKVLLLTKTVHTCPLRRDFQKVKKKKISVAEEGTTEADDKENAFPSVTYLPVNWGGSVTLRP